MLKLNHFDVFLMSYNYTMIPHRAAAGGGPQGRRGIGRHEVMAAARSPPVLQVDPDKLSKLTRKERAAALKWR